MRICSILLCFLFVLFSSYGEASETDKEIFTVPMSNDTYEVNVGPETETTFSLPNNQRLLKIVGGDVNLDVDAGFTKNIETNDWSVNVIKKRRGYIKFRNRYHYEVRLKPKKKIEPTNFVFVTNRWEHKFILVNSSAPVLLLIIDNAGMIGDFDLFTNLLSNSYWLSGIFGIVFLFSVFLVFKSKR